jgi:hypothetical protein
VRSSSAVTSDVIGDRHGVGQPFMGRNLIDRPQMRNTVRRRDIPMAHHLFANRLRLAEPGQQGSRRMPQGMERGAVDGAPEEEPARSTALRKSARMV